MVFYKVSPTGSGDIKPMPSFGHLLFGFAFLTLVFIAGFDNLSVSHVTHLLKVLFRILDVEVYLFQLLLSRSITHHCFSQHYESSLYNVHRNC